MHDITIDSELEFGLIEQVPLAPNTTPALYSSELYAEALLPFRRVSQRALANVIDGQMLMLMQAAEKAMTIAGDVYDAFVAEIDLGFGDLILSHSDAGAQRAYREWFEKLDVKYWVNDALLTTAVYGNAFTVALNRGADFTITNLNPKRVAVGRSAGTSLIAWFGENANGYRELFHKAEQPDFNEWQDIIDGGGMSIDPQSVYHLSTPKPHHQRYGLPRVIYAWNDITTRAVLDEMVRGTVEGVQNQIRLWRIKNPLKGEIAKLRSELRANRLSRVHDLAWDDRLTVDVIMPGVVDSLLANDTWIRLTAGIFRKLGMSLRLVSQTTGMETVGQQNTVEAEVMVQLSRLQRRVREPGLALAKRIAQWIAVYGEPSLATAGLPTLRVRDTHVAIREMMRNMYVPLLNFGLVSTQTVHEGIGLDHQVEIERLREEQPLREDGVIRPYTGFAQSGPGGVTEHRQSPGRPEQPDFDLENAATNKENANA